MSGISMSETMASNMVPGVAQTQRLGRTGRRAVTRKPAAPSIGTVNWRKNSLSSTSRMCL